MNKVKDGIFSLVHNQGLNKILPPYAVLPLILCPIINMVVYNGAQLLVRQRHHYDFTTAWDNLIPMVPAWTLDCQLHSGLPGEPGDLLRIFVR